MKGQTMRDTIYSMTSEERAAMRRLITNGVVVTVGEHARTKKQLGSLESAVAVVENSVRLVAKSKAVPDSMHDGMLAIADELQAALNQARER